MPPHPPNFFKSMSEAQHAWFIACCASILGHNRHTRRLKKTVCQVLPNSLLKKKKKKI